MTCRATRSCCGIFIGLERRTLLAPLGYIDQVKRQDLVDRQPIPVLIGEKKHKLGAWACIRLKLESVLALVLL